MSLNNNTLFPRCRENSPGLSYSQSNSRCPEPSFAHHPQLQKPRSAGGVTGGEAAERSEDTLEAGEHRGLLNGRWAAVLPTDSAEEPNF